MADLTPPFLKVQAPGVHIYSDESVHVVSLRYFDRSSAFSRATTRLIGVSLPEVCHATGGTSNFGETILAWRSPTETVLLCDQASSIEQLQTEAERHSDGCMVNLTGGTSVLRLSGEAVPQLFSRMGGQGAYPEVGEARRSRLADLAVFTLQVHAGDVLVLVDLMYCEHLLNWLRAAAGELSTTR
jgi:sarcosine oxidase gamma subunit